jgi:tRNA threonylcarbamoyladenosine biosynthesis protein TsaE
MSSPTYSIVNEYHTNSKTKLYHFDLYRLKSSEELFEIGFEDYVESGNYLFIEWPDLALPF